MDYDLAREAGVLEPRDHDYSADAWRALPETEREQFREQYEQAIEDSDLPDHHKQAKHLQLSMAGGLTLASVFKRYVAGVERWYA